MSPPENVSFFRLRAKWMTLPLFTLAFFIVFFKNQNWVYFLSEKTLKSLIICFFYKNHVPYTSIIEMTKQKLTFLSSTKNNITFLATIIQHLSNDFMVKYELYKKHKKNDENATLTIG